MIGLIQKKNFIFSLDDGKFKVSRVLIEVMQWSNRLNVGPTYIE